MSVFSHLRRLRKGEHSLKCDVLMDAFIFCFTFLLPTFSMHSRPLAPLQTWRLTGYRLCDVQFYGILVDSTVKNLRPEFMELCENL